MKFPWFGLICWTLWMLCYGGCAGMSAPLAGFNCCSSAICSNCRRLTKPDEWNLLSNYYASPYFFSSQALSRSDLVTIELETVYRQSDPDFIRLLNAVRENRMDSHCTEILNQRVQPDPPDQGYITLTTHNRRAESINDLKLARLRETAHILSAEVSGDFPSHAFPTGEQLTLKPGGPGDVSAQ